MREGREERGPREGGRGEERGREGGGRREGEGREGGEGEGRRKG